MLADYLGLSPATVSLVLNRSPVANSIPQETKDRVLPPPANLTTGEFRGALPAHAAQLHDWRAGAGSQRRVRCLGDGRDRGSLAAGGLFLSGCEPSPKPDLIDEYPRVLQRRSVEGLIAVDTPWTRQIPIPVVAVSGRGQSKGITNIVLDYDRAAELALEHLCHLGHRRIAGFPGATSFRRLRFLSTPLVRKRLPGARDAPAKECHSISLACLSGSASS